MSEPRPNPREIYDEASTSGPYRSLIVFGGQTWTNGEGRPMYAG